jgi:aspartate-semialdehyde dehydrogenase
MPMGVRARIGVVGATGAVGTVTLALLAERGFEDVRAFASARSAGSRVPFGERELRVEEATSETLSGGDIDLFFFSVGTSASRALVPVAAASGAICVDKSSAYRLVDGYPLVVPEVNGRRALDALGRDRIVANPNCCTIPLTCVLKPLHDVAGLVRVRVSTYQSVSGAGAQRMTALAEESPVDHDLVMDWAWEGDESDEESKLRAETRKILELPGLPISATCVRVPVMVGHSEAIWVELEQALEPDEAADLLRGAPGLRVLDLPSFPTPAAAAGTDDVLVGRIRRDASSENGIALYLSSDNLRKGAALNAIQIAEVVLDGVAVARG